jgi:hypothetical protein
LLWAVRVPDVTELTSQASATPKRKPLGIWIAAAVVVFVAAGAVLVYTMWPKGFDVTGSLTVSGAGSLARSTGQTCVGTGGYSDLHPGTPVVISDASGTTIAIGSLDPAPFGGTTCVFPFKVAGVPDGHDFYGVAVSNRGRLSYDAARMHQHLSLSIG